jgi:hypothetical protein
MGEFAAIVNLKWRRSLLVDAAAWDGRTNGSIPRSAPRLTGEFVVRIALDDLSDEFARDHERDAALAECRVPGSRGVKLWRYTLKT